MYEKFIALAFVLAATVEGQDCDPYYGDCSEATDAAAPIPTFPMDPATYVFMDIPEDATDFMKVLFGVFDEFNDEALDSWISDFDWENHTFPMPTYEVFAGCIGYSDKPLFDAKVGVFFSSDSFAMRDQDSYKGIYAAGLDNGEFTDAYTAIFPKDNAPVDGDVMDWSNLEMMEEFPEGTFLDNYSGGVSRTLGYNYNEWTRPSDDKLMYELQYWHYNSGG